MKPTISNRTIISLIALLSLLSGITHASPLGTAFTYQGKLTDGGSGANGSYDLKFSLYDAVTNGNQTGVTLTNTAVTVSNGLFTAVLDFGADVFTGDARWLEVGVRTGTNNFTALTPRQPVTPTPYAFYSPSAGSMAASNLVGIIPDARISGTYSSAVNFTNPGNSFKGAFAGNGFGLNNLDAAALGSGVVPDARLSTNVVIRGTDVNFDNIIAGGNVVVSNDLVADRLNVGSVNLLAGSFSSIAGGRDNIMDGDYSFIGGGEANNILSGVNNAIAGGGGNIIDDDYSFIGGGQANGIALSSHGAIAGGFLNRMENAGYAFIGGGEVNMTCGSNCVIAGGFLNTILSNYCSTISGGFDNLIRDGSTNGWPATIGGGCENRIWDDAGGSTIAGGAENTIQTESWVSTIGGGWQNTIQNNVRSATIGGGIGNTINFHAWSSTIGGGADNTIQNYVGGGTIGGGDLNKILTNGSYATIPGGEVNEAGGFCSFAAGRGAHALHDRTFVWSDGTDGYFESTGPNQFLISAHGFVGINTNHPQSTLHVNGMVTAYAFVGDGSQLTGIAIGSSTNAVTLGGHYASEFAMLNSSPTFTGNVTAGGDLNATRLKIGIAHSLSGLHAAIAGGSYNNNASADATICGGSQNTIQENASDSTIGGGYGNTIMSGISKATIPGGSGNVAGGDCSFAAGYHARALNNGSFVWADNQESYFDSTDVRQFLIRAEHGVGINTTNPQATLHVNGTATVESITITGGSDVAEPFPISTEQIAKGAVVVIDEENPGRLKISDYAYDTKVAGIVSGANGIKPGISLSQQRLVEGGHNVALSGRVYALADASNGPIQPGDLLTTSATPGHAMKVTNHAKAQGAILGKAMSSLKEGRGMVLVLVSLQ